MAKSWHFHTKNVIFLINFNVMWWIESNIRAPVLLNLLNSLQKVIKCLASLPFYHFSRTSYINSIKHEHSCKIPIFNIRFMPIAKMIRMIKNIRYYDCMGESFQD